MEHLIEAPHEVPVTGEYDVIVVGGGPAGVSAAVAASRSGAKVAIVERYGYLGGQATGGLVILIVGLTNGKERIFKGFCEETVNRLKKLNAAKDIDSHVLFDPESMKYIFDCFIEESNVTPYYHCFVSGTIMVKNRVQGIIIEGKSGRRIIKGRMFVDATGDGDLAKYCNIPFDIAPKNDLLPVTLGFRVGGIDVDKVRKYTTENKTEYMNLLNEAGISTRIGGWIQTLHHNEAWFNISNIENINSTSCEDMTKAEIQGRKQVFKIIESFRKNIPGFEAGYLIDTAAQLGVRDSRRIKGKHYYTNIDLTKNFDDTVALAPNYTGTGNNPIQIPYGCLVSPKSENVIFAGRCISISHELLDSIREIPCCMATGRVAGTASAVAVKNSTQIGMVDVNSLRECLKSSLSG